MFKMKINDIFNINFDKKVLKQMLPKWFYKKYMITRNFDKEKIIAKEDIELSDLFELNQGGWVLSEDKKFLTLYI